MEELFASFFDGSITPEQERELWSYINASEENAKAFNKADADWRNNPQISAQLSREFTQLKQRECFRRRRTFGRRITFAAAFAAACLAAVVMISPETHFRHQKGVLHYAGSMEDQKLPDGSLVCLNKCSELSYDFSRKKRTVTLDGEALFDVQHDDAVPFVVSCGKCRITVLGTRFSVTDYSSDSNAQVILAEGSLSVDMQGGQDKLVPGDKVYFNGSEVTKTKVDISEVENWKSGAIIFELISLGDFINRLSREYGVNIELRAEKYVNSTFRASFQREESMANILQTVCEIFPLQLETLGNGYVLK